VVQHYRDYMHRLATRPEPAAEVQELALARLTIASLERRIRELEAGYSDANHAAPAVNSNGSEIKSD
jgi:hypothetical protein